MSWNCDSMQPTPYANSRTQLCYARGHVNPYNHAIRAPCRPCARQMFTHTHTHTHRHLTEAHCSFVGAFALFWLLTTCSYVISLSPRYKLFSTTNFQNCLLGGIIAPVKNHWVGSFVKLWSDTVKHIGHTYLLVTYFYCHFFVLLLLLLLFG